MDLTKSVLIETKEFPKHEMDGLISQINRSAVSIPSNIAIGSCYELETQIELAFSMEYIEESLYQKLINDIVEIEKMLNSFQNTLN